MARWKLMIPHYLNLTTPTEWEHTETTRKGTTLRQRFVVPRMLDPSDPQAWNNSWGTGTDLEGEIIVCKPGTGNPRDYEFLGDPTPDMMPLDDDAKALSATFTDHWSYRPDGADQSFSTSLIDRFEESMATLASKPATVEVAGLNELVAAMSQQQQLMLQILSASAGSVASATTVRR